MELESGYRLDDLMIGGFRLIQNTKQFCFGTDSVLLADFAVAHTKGRDRVAELCCGNGAVSVLMLARRIENHITGFELQKDVCGLCERNIELNCLGEHMDVVNTDLKFIGAEHYNTYDAVVVNPPYYSPGRGPRIEDENRRLSREEDTADLSDIVTVAKKMLKTKGKLIMVYRASRLGELTEAFASAGFALKTLRCVHSKTGSPASLVLVCASKLGGAWCDIEPPVIIYNDDGSYTKDLLKIYHMDGEEDI